MTRSRRSSHTTQRTPAAAAYTRHLTPAAERLLAAAGELFYAHGITSVGVDRIADTAGTTKKTLYDRFGSKDGLITAYLQRRFDLWKAYCLAHLDEKAPDAGVPRVLAVFDALEAWMVDNDRGCGFINAFAELAGTGHTGLDVIRDEKTWMRGLYVELLAAAGIDDPDGLGLELALLHEGAIVQLTAGDVPTAMTAARSLAARLITTRP